MDGNFEGTKSLWNILGGLKSNVGIFRGTIYLFNHKVNPPPSHNVYQFLDFLVRVHIFQVPKRIILLGDNFFSRTCSRRYGNPCLLFVASS
jgi:hypothetical protein